MNKDTAELEEEEIQETYYEDYDKLVGKVDLTVKEVRMYLLGCLARDKELGNWYKRSVDRKTGYAEWKLCSTNLFLETRTISFHY